MRLLLAGVHEYNTNNVSQSSLWKFLANLCDEYTEDATKLEPFMAVTEIYVLPSVTKTGFNATVRPILSTMNMASSFTVGLRLIGWSQWSKHPCQLAKNIQLKLWNLALQINNVVQRWLTSIYWSWRWSWFFFASHLF